MVKSLFNSISLALIIIILYGVQCFGQTPTDVIRNANKKITEIQKSSNDPKQIESQVAKVLDETTSYVSITNNVKSAICVNISEVKCREFAEEFTELLKISYSKKLSKYNSDQLEYLGEKITGLKAIVNTKIKLKDRVIKIDYELEKINKKWVIINYIFDDINTVENYKKQFLRILKNESIDKIIQNLRKKIDELKSGKDD